MSEKNKNDLASLLEERSLLKQDVYKRTCEAYNEFKAIIEKKIETLREQIPNERVRLKYDSNGDFETHAYIGSDVLVFHMHTNVFSFPKEHGVWKNSYVEEDADRAYCGVINIYNFLADSFLHNRLNDAGYMIGRVYINKDGHFMVEGKGQLGFLFKDFKGSTFDEASMHKVLEVAMKHAIEFDLHSPPYEKVQFVDVMQIKTLSSAQEMKTGKRLGFRFKSELE
tara:strand:+ start:26296 stop:26970 length:675 start_codon:yes stop_codon:yes gene_type:complete